MNPYVWLALGAWALGTTLLSYAAFKYGYGLGWEERHRDMILPRNIVTRTGRDVDDIEASGRHSALDPKKPVWHPPG